VTGSLSGSRFRETKVTPHLVPYLCAYLSLAPVPEIRWPRRVSTAYSRIPLSVSGRRAGAESDPSPIVRSTAPESEPMRVLIAVVRGRSQPAPAAPLIPAGRLPAPPAAGSGGGRRSFRRRRGPRRRPWRSGDRSRTPLTASWARSPALGSRRTSAAWSKVTCSAWVRSAATTAVRPLRRARTGAGVRGRSPGPLCRHTTRLRHENSRISPIYHQDNLSSVQNISDEELCLC
jgi:hypothetical protein